MSDLVAPDPDLVARTWQAYVAARGEAAGLPAEPDDVFAFGDSAALADELADLVLHGPKRATAGLVADLDGDPPAAGEHSVVVGGDGAPVCLIRTTQVRIGPLGSVDASFAWDEGEGDRTLAWWTAAHERYFRRRCEDLGLPFTPDLEVCFERFALVWPEPDEEGSAVTPL